MKKQIIWEDATTYSRNEIRKQSIWAMQGKRLRIAVMNNHRYYPGQWVMTCHQINVDVERLNIPSDSSPDIAQKKALYIVNKVLSEMLAEIETI